MKIRVWTNMDVDRAVQCMKIHGYDVAYAIDLPDAKTVIHRERWEKDTDSIVLVAEGEAFYILSIQDAKLEGMPCPRHCYEVTEAERENVEVMVGLNDKDTHQQEMAIDEAMDLVGDIFPDCTIQECTGFYKGERERSLKVSVYGVTLQEAMDKAHEAKRRFNQECVIVTEIKTQVSHFIY